MKKTQIERFFVFDGDRYFYDNKLTSSKGWAQIDDSQDAPYYGQWANPITLEYVSYCEGDVCVANFASIEEFVEWIANCAKFDSFKGIDTLCNVESTAKFQSIGLGHLLY